MRSDSTRLPWPLPGVEESVLNMSFCVICRGKACLQEHRTARPVDRLRARCGNFLRGSTDVDGAVEDRWNALGEPWRECFRLAWAAYRAGTVPVGAVVVRDADAAIVA